MKYIIILLLAFGCMSCSAPKIRVKNCNKVGEVAGEKIYDCEEYKAPKGYEAR